MEPKFQTSFIPKAPLPTASNAGRSLPRESSMTLLPTIASILFVLSLLAAGGLFGYQSYLNSQIADLDKSLKLAQTNFDQSSIQPLVVASNQIKSAKSLLAKHIAVSNLFAVLESNVLPSVQFTTFGFQRSADNKVDVSIDGAAQSYASAAKQADLFNSLSYMSNQTFSNLDLTDKGTISMKFRTTVDQSVLSYAQAVQNISSDTIAPVVPAVSASTTTSASTTLTH